MKRIHTSLAVLFLALTTAASFGAAVTYPGPLAVDDTGATVSPTSISVASVTDLDGNAIASPGAVGHVAGNATSVVYDAAAKGEAWITLTPVLSGHTFANNPPKIFASADPQTLATVNTTATGTNTRVTISLPNAAPGASGGIPTIGTGAGQINPDGTGSVPIALGQALPATPTLRTVGAAMFYADRQIGRLGTAQGGTSTTITLDASASATDNIYSGHFIVLTGGTGAGQTATISSYVGSTKVATISRPGGVAWSTTPDTTTTFVIIPVAQSTLLAGQSISASNFVAAPAVAVDGSGRVLLQPTQTGVTIPVVTSLTNPVVASSVTGNVTVGGYAAGFDPATLLLVTPANKIATNSSNQVTTSNPSSGSSVTDASIWAYGTRTLTAQSDTPGVTTLLTRIPGVVQPQTGDSYARLGVPAGASHAADIAALPTAAAITAAVWAKVIDGSITAWDSLVLLDANILGAGTNSYNAGTRVLTSVKMRQNGTTPAYTTSVTLNAGSAAPAPASATVTPGTLP